jgi:hypothetical protein
LLKKSCGEHKTLKQVCISATHYPPLVTNLKSPNFLQLMQPLKDEESSVQKAVKSLLLHAKFI